MSGIYLHIPFCRQKCHYCDFHFSVSQKNKLQLIESIVREIALRKNEINQIVDTVYFGGGTPSVLEERELKEILNHLHQNFKIKSNAEITLEANPDDLSLSYLQMLKNVGINRLSIGIQSFHDDELKQMNRSHNAKQAFDAVKNAQSIGLENITIDLIYGMPDTNIEKWKYNIDTFFELNIPHLSAYALTVEHKTALEYMINSKKINPVNEQSAFEQFYYLRRRMMENGYDHYEISNFSKSNFYSKHNTSYWQNQPYLGIGPSAHSYNLKERSWNISNNNKYIKSLKNNELPSQKEILSKKDLYNEYIMTGLRTKWGVSIKKIEGFGEIYKEYFDKKVQFHLKNNNISYKNTDELSIEPEAMFKMDGIISDFFMV